MHTHQTELDGRSFILIRDAPKEAEKQVSCVRVCMNSEVVHDEARGRACMSIISFRVHTFLPTQRLLVADVTDGLINAKREHMYKEIDPGYATFLMRKVHSFT
jgi:hypothetical protein